jgi:serine-type D-Ala-D-Ala carboxypeptidase (penicillin-binding protein 5/6)
LSIFFIMESQNTYKRLLALFAFLIGASLVLFSVARNDVARILDVTPPAKPTVGAISAGLHEQKQQELIVPSAPRPELTAHAYLVRFIGDNRPLLRQREWKALPPASLTKLLTAVIARESLPATLWILFSETAKKTEPKISPVGVGEFLLRDDAVRSALIVSHNDAAVALAEAVENQYDQERQPPLTFFAELMNEKAQELGMTNSFFKNPSGLDGNEHVASAEDLATLAEYIWGNHRRVWEISRTIETRIYTDRGREIVLENTNDLLKEFPAILGGKTGFTDNAKDTLLFFYPVRPDKVVVAVILGSEDRFEDGRKIIRWLETINK